MRWRRAVEGQLDAAVGEALAVEAVGEPEAAQQLDGRVLEHAGPDAVLDVLAVALLEHDAVDAPRREQVGEHEPGRTGADDRHLGLVGRPPSPMMRSAGHAQAARAPGGGAGPGGPRARATDTMNAVAATSHSTSSTSSDRRRARDENPPPPGRLHACELHGRRASRRAAPPTCGRRRRRGRSVLLDLAGQVGPQRHRHRSAGVAPDAASSSAYGVPPTAASRSASANASNPPVSVSWPVSVVVVVVAVGGDRAVQRMRRTAGRGWQQVRGLGGRRHRVAEHDAQPAVVGRRRPVDGPAGGDGVVEAQVGGQSGRLLHDLGVGDRGDGELPVPSGPITSSTVASTRHAASSDHAEHGERAAGRADREAPTGWRIAGPDRLHPRVEPRALSGRRGDLLDDQVEALEALGARAEREVGDDDLVDADVGPALHGLDQPLGGAADGRARGDALDQARRSSPGRRRGRTAPGVERAIVAGSRPMSAHAASSAFERSAKLGRERPHVPLVGVAGDDAHHPVALAADQDRQRVLHRLRLDDRVGEPVVLAVDGRRPARAAGPSRTWQRLLEAVDAHAGAAELDAVLLVLVDLPAGADAEQQAAAGHVVDRRRPSWPARPGGGR